jgi:hypothetical protein
LHIAGRIEKHLDRLKPGFDGAALAIDRDKAEAERLRARWGGSLPSTIFQKNEFLSKMPLSLCPE